MKSIIRRFIGGKQVSDETREAKPLTDAERAELEARAKKAWPENVPRISGCCDSALNPPA